MNANLDSEEYDEPPRGRPKLSVKYLLYALLFVVVFLVGWIGIKLVPSAVTSVIYPVHSHYATTASMKPVTLVVAPIQIAQSKTPEVDEAKANLNLSRLNVPLAYLQYEGNWEGGYQTFVNIFYNFETLKPTSLGEKNPRAVDDLHGFIKLTYRVGAQATYSVLIQGIRSDWKSVSSDVTGLQKFESPLFKNGAADAHEASLNVVKYIPNAKSMCEHVYITCYPEYISCTLFDDSDPKLSLQTTVPRARMSEWESIRHNSVVLINRFNNKQ